MLYWVGLMLTFNHVHKPFNMLSGISQAYCYCDPADGHTDHVVKDHQLHRNSGTFISFHFFFFSLFFFGVGEKKVRETMEVSDERYVQGPGGFHDVLGVVFSFVFPPS